MPIYNIVLVKMSEFLDQILTTPLVKTSRIPHPPSQQWVIGKNRNAHNVPKKGTQGGLMERNFSMYFL